MAYWWVSQNKTYRQERDGGYLWAPKRDANGRRQFHWETMTRVQPGDVIFSFAQQAIGAVGVATSAARDAQQPSELNNEWDNDGWRVDVDYQPVKPAVALSSFVSELVPLLPDRYAPLSEKGSGNQGYLFELPPEAGRLVAERAGGVAPVEEIVERVIARSILDQTTRDALVKARVGQGGWRTDLLRYWRGQCAITGLTVEPLLRASHIKPWRDSDNAERLDVFNGLLLGAAYDAAFDAGLIAFDDDGRIVISTGVADEQREAAGLDAGATLRAITDQHRRYLAYHRDEGATITVGRSTPFDPVAGADQLPQAVPRAQCLLVLELALGRGQLWRVDVCQTPLHAEFPAGVAVHKARSPVARLRAARADRYGAGLECRRLMAEWVLTNGQRQHGPSSTRHNLSAGLTSA